MENKSGIVVAHGHIVDHFVYVGRTEDEVLSSREGLGLVTGYTEIVDVLANFNIFLGLIIYIEFCKIAQSNFVENLSRFLVD